MQENPSAASHINNHVHSSQPQQPTDTAPHFNFGPSSNQHILAHTHSSDVVLLSSMQSLPSAMDLQPTLHPQQLPWKSWLAVPSPYLHIKLTPWPTLGAMNALEIQSLVVVLAAYHLSLPVPLDMVKIRLQNQVKELAGRPMSARHTFETIFKSEGLRGLYRGMGVTAAGYLPTWAIYFSAYEWAKINSHDRCNKLHLCLSALHAGLLSTSITNPIWVVRARIMTQHAKPGPSSLYHYTSTLDGLVTIFRKEGWRALYKGLGPSIVGVSHVAIQFPLYEKLKLVLKDSDGQIGGHEIVFASAISKMVASSVTYPHEVVRTRFQTQLSLHSNTNIEAPSLLPRSTSLNTNPILSTKAGPMASSVLENAQVAVGGSALLPKYRGILQAVRTILREEGWRGFYKGFALGLFRTVPASALTI
ncbi:hypothetical protein BSLG_009043 [Batrachochytrium salamandrivorans]|nr:hypothetical protein BSLG_009043 [Batrachochytrium salamandrivorans]